MRTPPKVSVVVTCFNYGRFLPEALHSALGQTHANLEVIVVNDGSTDNTDEVMREFTADQRVVYVKQANAGQAVAKNVGIARSSGELVAFLDADDFWEPTKLEKQVRLFAQPDVGVVYTMMSFVDEYGNRSAYRTTDRSRPRRGRVTRDLFVDNFVPFSSSVVRKSCFDKAGVMDESLRMAIDWDLWLRMSVHYSFEFVDEPLLLYRVGHAGQMSKSYFVRAKDQMTIMKTFVANNPGAIPDRLMHWVMAFSYCNRGYHSRRINARESLAYYGNALKWRWWHLPAYEGIIKTVAYKVLRICRLDGSAGRGAS